jgi:hypothetical protein
MTTEKRDGWTGRERRGSRLRAEKVATGVGWGGGNADVESRTRHVVLGGITTEKIDG